MNDLERVLEEMQNFGTPKVQEWAARIRAVLAFQETVTQRVLAEIRKVNEESAERAAARSPQEPTPAAPLTGGPF